MKAPARILPWVALVALLTGAQVGQAQVAPSARVVAAYDGLLKAAAEGNAAKAAELLAGGAAVDRRDGYRRTPLHVAAYGANHPVMRTLVAAGADPNALENDDYDIVTIAAVANDLETLKLALALGCKPGNVTSRYEGTALIAAAHLGHADVVQVLINAGAPLDHVNNLGWTAVIEAIVLGDGGSRHQATLQALINAGADLNIPDSNGVTPLGLALNYGYGDMARMLRAAGATVRADST